MTHRIEIGRRRRRISRNGIEEWNNWRNWDKRSVQDRLRRGGIKFYKRDNSKRMKEMQLKRKIKWKMIEREGQEAEYKNNNEIEEKGIEDSGKEDDKKAMARRKLAIMLCNSRRVTQPLVVITVCLFSSLGLDSAIFYDYLLSCLSWTFQESSVIMSVLFFPGKLKYLAS